MLTDLQKFIIKFGLECRALPGKVEYRGVQDLDRVIGMARELIVSEGWELEARTEGNSAGMRSFFVVEV